MIEQFKQNSTKVTSQPLSLLNVESFPEKISNNVGFQEKALQRIELEKLLRLVFSRIDPKINISDALKSELLSENDLIDIYTQLTNFLETDPNNARIILYLPLNLLPDSQNFGNELSSCYRNFIEVYRNNWFKLLDESDVRASFVDGDVHEEGMPAPERVRKAAHLLPFLLAKSIVTLEEVQYLIEICEDEQLIESLNDGLAATESATEIESTEKFTNLDELFKNFLEEVNRINIEGDFSDGRKRWLDEVETERLVNKYAQLIVDCSLVEQIEITNLVDHKNIYNLVLLAIFEYCQRNNSISQEQIQIIRTLGSLLDDKTQVSSGMRKLSRLGIINSELLNEFSVEVIDLSNPSLELVKSDIREFTNATELIRNHPVLNQFLFDQVLIFGSKVKGYAEVTSDSDVVVFFRPEADFNQRVHVLEVLRTEIPQFKSLDKILEFWMDKDEQGFKFRNVERTATIVGATEIHILFGGVWVGDNSLSLRADLISKYMDLSRLGSNQEEIRAHLLRQLELDVLQFRIMHKGYRRAFPKVKVLPPANPDLIDWESDFWDEGYRRTATLLFLSRVFLPNLNFEL